MPDIKISSNSCQVPSGKLKHATQHTSTESFTETFPSLSDWSMVERFQASVNGFSDFSDIWEFNNSVLEDMKGNSGNTIAFEGDQYDVQFDDFFTLYIDSQLPSSTEFLAEPNQLLANIRSLYTLITAQIAKEYLMTPGSDRQQGNLVTTQQRLRIRGLSLYAMFATLSVLLVLVLLPSWQEVRSSIHSFQATEQRQRQTFVWGSEIIAAEVFCSHANQSKLLELNY